MRSLIGPLTSFNLDRLLSLSSSQEPQPALYPLDDDTSMTYHRLGSVGVDLDRGVSNSKTFLWEWLLLANWEGSLTRGRGR